MTVCPSCNTQNEPGAAFCDNCGTALSAAPPPQRPAAPANLPPTTAVGGMTCPQCGRPVMPGEAFCDNCGAALSGIAAPPPPMQQPAPPQWQPQAAPPAGAIKCPSCGTMAAAGAAFCDNCGASLSNLSGAPPAQPQWQQPQPQPWQQPQQPPPQQWQQPPQPQPQWQQPPPQQWQPQAGPPPRLVIQSNNASLPFPANKAEIIAGREDPVSNVFPEVNLDPYGGDEGGISRRHAKFTLQGSQWYVQDLNSTNFTFVNKQKLQPNQPHPVNNGDEVRLGKIVMMFFTS